MANSTGKPDLKPADETEPGTKQSAEGLCPRCSGAGTLENKPCPDCDGTGTVEVIVGDA